MTLAPTGLVALARKYRALAALREAHARGEPTADRATLRALAGEFPGALRELDRLPLEVIRARAAALEAAARGGVVEPWMAWLDAWHRILVAALAVRAGHDRGAAVDDARAEAIALDASARAGIEVDARFVRAAIAPPGGRVVVAARAEIEARFGADAARWVARELAPALR